jgi:hypothetical protein
MVLAHWVADRFPARVVQVIGKMLEVARWDNH